MITIFYLLKPTNSLENATDNFRTDFTKEKSGFFNSKIKREREKRTKSIEKIYVADSIYRNIYTDESGSAISCNKGIDIDVHRTIFHNCSAALYGGAIFSTNGSICSILLCCFSNCFTLSNFGSALSITGLKQTLHNTTLYACGRYDVVIVCHFDGNISDVSQTNFSRSNVRYSVSCYTAGCKSPTLSYSNVAQCNSSSGVALHANNCSDAVFSNTNVVNNTDMAKIYGLMHFHSTNALLYRVVVINNIGFSFASPQTTTVTSEECYSDSSSSFGFTIDLLRTAGDDRRLTHACELTTSSVLGTNKRFIFLIMTIIDKNLMLYLLKILYLEWSELMAETAKLYFIQTFISY